MNVEKQDEILRHAKMWVLEAGQLIKDRLHQPLEIETKSSPNDLVTSVDKYIERFFVEKVKSTFPDHLLYSEEGYGDPITTMDGTVWIVDPIDGTMNFVHQKKNFAISVGIYEYGKGIIGLIYDVMADNLYIARRGKGAFKNEKKLPSLSSEVTLTEAVLGFNHSWLCNNRVVEQDVMQSLVKKIRGVRTYGSAALEFAFVAEGSIDGYLSMRLSPWDFAAGAILVNEVGGLTTDMFGKPLSMLEKSSIFTCNPKIQQPVIEDFLVKGKK